MAILRIQITKAGRPIEVDTNADLNDDMLKLALTEGLKVLDAVAASAGMSFEKTHYDLGARRYNATGETLPDSVLAEQIGRAHV